MIRVKPTPSTDAVAWELSKKRIKLDPQYGKAVSSQDYAFDEILSGSENKPVYNAVARSHVCAAMDGYNAVVFAYGQTASGKTFTLVSSPSAPAYRRHTYEYRQTADACSSPETTTSRASYHAP